MAVSFFLFFAILPIAVVVANVSPSVNGPESMSVKFNKSTSLQCTTVPYGLTVEWYTGSIFTNLTSIDDMSRKHYHVDDEGNLKVTEFRNRHHGGDYTCHVSSSSMQHLYSCPGTLSHAKIATEYILEPSNTTAPSGSVVILECIPPFSNPSPFILWKKDGSFFLPPDNAAVSMRGSLYLLNVTKEDEGYYECSAINIVTGTIRHSRKAHLFVTDEELSPTIPMFIVTPQDITAQVGEDIEFECITNTGSDVQWERIGHMSLPISSSILNNGALKITKIEEYFGGTYCCSNGNLSTMVTLKVVAPPSIILSSDTTSGTPGTNVTLSCSPSSPSLMEEIHIIWQFGGTLLQSEQNVSISSLTFVIPEGPDEIWFQCLMSNQYGCDQKSIAITIITENATESTTPTDTLIPGQIADISVNVNETTISPGGSTDLFCLVNVKNGGSLASLAWTTFGGSFSVILELHNNPSYVIQVRITSVGIYSCLATVAIGDEVELFQKHVFVTEETTTIPSVPSTTSLSSSSSSSSSSIFIITPSPSISSSLSDVTMSPPSPTSSMSSIQILSTSSLSIATHSTTTQVPTPTSVSVPDDLAVYTSPTEVNAPEGSHVNLTCTAKGPGFLVVKWTQNSVELSGNTYIEDAYTTTSVLQLNPLLPSHQGIVSCTVEMFVFNGSILEVTSVIKNITINVLAVAPSLPPSGIITQWLTDTTLQVLWLPPPVEAISSQILGYKLNWARTGSDLLHAARIAVPFNTLFYNITDLNNKLSYDIIVWAYSKGGDGPFIMTSQVPSSVTEPPTNPTPSTTIATTNPVTMTTMTPSTLPPTAVIDIHSCIISTIPSEGSVILEVSSSRYIDHFDIDYVCTEANVNHRIQINSHMEEIPVTLTGLLPGCTYTVTASAIDNNGNIVSATSCDLETNDDHVSIDFEIDWKNTNDLSISWELPSSLEQHDNVIIEVNIEGTWVTIEDGEHLFSDLDPYEAHTVEVRLRVGDLIIHNENFIIPAQPRPSIVPSVASSPVPKVTEETSMIVGDSWLTYGVGISVLLLTILLAILLILLLKHIQAKRRETDKVTDHRNVMFERQNSKTSSIKKPYVTNTVNSTYIYT